MDLFCLDLKQASISIVNTDLLPNRRENKNGKTDIYLASRTHLGPVNTKNFSKASLSWLFDVSIFLFAVVLKSKKLPPLLLLYLLKILIFMSLKNKRKHQ